MTWTLTLKKGRTFHDGTPVNADAVKYSIDRMVDPERKAPQRVLFAPINMTRPPTDNLKVRQALNYAVDKDAIIRVVLNGAGSPSRTVLEKPLLGSKAIGPYPYDPKKARQLLKEAGADGATIDIVVSQGNHVQDAATGEAVANYLKAVGLKVNLKVLGDQPAYVELMRRREHSAAFIAWSPGTFDPDQVLRRLLWGENAGKPWNFGAFKDDAVDALIERAAGTLDPEARKALYEEIQEKIFAQVPWIFLHQLNGVSLLRADIDNLHVLPGVEILLLADARRTN